MFIFRGLKKPPKLAKKHAEAVVFGTESGSMDTGLMLKYCDQVLAPHLQGRPGLLLMDSYGCHYAPPVLERLKNLNIEVLIIPGGTTSVLQPLDVSINKPLKDHFKDEWLKWFNNTPALYTEKGNRKKPSYDQLVDMSLKSIGAIERSIIRESFQSCGLMDSKLSLWSNFILLNNKLQAATFFTSQTRTDENYQRLIQIFEQSNDKVRETLIESFAKDGHTAYLETHAIIE